MMRQIRISVNGVFQFSVRVQQDQPLEVVAQQAHDVMRLGDVYVPVITTGQINFIPRRVV